MLTLCHNFFRVTPNSKNNKDSSQHVSKKQYIFGIFLLLLVVVLWVISSEVTKYIYEEKQFDRPFLLTYVRSSLLFVYLIVLCFSPPTKDPCRPPDYTQLLEPTAETDDENYFSESTNTLGDSTFVPVRAGETTDSDDAAPRAVRFNKVAEVRVMSAAQAGEALLARLSWAASMRASQHAQRRAAAAATRRHLRLALTLTVPWFMSNYLFRVSLQHGAPSSATVYTSTAGALALSLSALSAQAPADRFNMSKCIAVLLTAAGLVVLGISEGEQSNLVAVLSALASALCYAVHLLLFRRELRKGDGINSPLFVGLVGCVSGSMTLVVWGGLALGGAERASLPPPAHLSWLLVDAALGPLLIETLWLWGRSLTSSRTASGMLSLVVPGAVLARAWRGAAGAGAGAAAVLAAAGWLAPHLRWSPAAATWIPTFRKNDAFSSIKNISELDEQSEALMTADEPT